MKKSAIVISFLILAVLFASPVPASAQTKAGIKPGSVFYFFDTTFEKINLFFTFNPEKKAQKALEYASERLAEVQAIQEEENPDAIKTAITNYENNVALATKKSKEVKDKGQAENLLNLIADNTSKNQEVLSAVLIKVPEEAKEAIARAIEASRKNQEEAMKQIADLKGEVEQLKKEVAELKTKNEEQEKVIEEADKQKTENISKTTPTITKPISTEENNVSIPLGFLDGIINNYSSSIDYARETISLIEDTEQHIKKVKASMEGLRDSTNDSTVIGVFNLFIEQYNSNIQYYDQLIKNLNDNIEKMNENKNLAVQYKIKISSLFYTKEQANFEAKKLFIDLKNSWAFQETLSKTYSNYSKYYDDQNQQYEEAFAYLKGRTAVSPSVNSSTQNFVQTFTPTIPIQPIIQPPKTTYCTISGDGGVGLQSYVNCTTY